MSGADDEALVLVDGSSYLFRAYHALPPLTNSKGQPTGAVYGVVAMLKRLLESEHPRHVAVVFDAPGKTFRDAIYPQYKANRPPTPEDLVAQIQPLHDLVRALGIPLVMIHGVEADDVIGTFAVSARARGWHTRIITGDKDFAQLVGDDIVLVDTMKNVELDRDGVQAKFGVTPEQIIDYLTLIGDTVDNVPGVPKVGPKTAAKWLAEYGSLDALVEQADAVGGKVGENLPASLEQLPLSRELVTIRTHCELPVGLDELKPGAPDHAALARLYAELEFRTWLDEALSAAPEANNTPDQGARYETIASETALDGWIKRLNQAKLFAFDTETTSLDYMEAEIVGVSFAVEPGHAAYVPLAHRGVDVPDQLDREQVLARLKPLLEDPGRGKLLQNAKYDMNVLVNHDIRLAGVAHDTMLESYVLDSTATRHDMDSLALKYLGYKTIHFEDIAGRGKSQLRFDEIGVAEAAQYAAEDADVTLRLHEALWPKLEPLEAQARVYREIEIPLIPVLSRMERTGVRIDAGMLAKQSAEIEKQLGVLEKQAHEAAGGPFNLGSPKQLQEILFDRLKLPSLAKTPKGQPSTAESVLEQLAEDYELPRLILDHRSLAKLKSTYTDKLPAQISARSGRVHTSFHQAVAATGRLSSSEPNLQNIPVRTAEGRRIRQAFVAEDGWRIVSADYSQIELRIMAHLSGDEGLRRAFAKGLDIHRATAAEVFGAEPDAVTNDQRRSAKAINFGLIYGMSAFGLARNLGIERDEAASYIERYFARYPGVREFMDATRKRAHETGYVETVFGRRLHLPEINSSNAQRRQYAERTAINAPMQGTAADIIKRAMIDVDAWIEASRPPVRMVLQVHDELVFEVREDAVEASIEQIRARMSGAAELAVPLVVDAGVGANWDEAH